MQIRIHPKSLPITKGWSQIGPRPLHRRAIHSRDLKKAFRDTLNKQENPRVRRIRQKIADGTLTDTDAILGVIDVMLMVRPPKVFTKDHNRVIEKKVVTRAA